MKAIVNPDVCSGCGLCAETCPKVFQLDDEGVARVIVEEVPPELEDQVKEAAEDCPDEAISTEE